MTKEKKIFVYHGADSAVVRLSADQAARFFNNRDPREWEFVRFEYETEESNPEDQEGT